MMALARREFHMFQAAGRDFLYLVPSAAVFALDAPTSAVLSAVAKGPESDEGVVTALAERFDAATVRAAISELLDVRAIGYEHQPDEAPPRMLPMMQFPLNTMVMNVTNQCNLACTYCYEYGEDKIVDTSNGKQSKFMAESTALESVDFLVELRGPPARVSDRRLQYREIQQRFPAEEREVRHASALAQQELDAVARGLLGHEFGL